MNVKIIKASRALKENKLLAYPTEAVFGLGCLASSTQAIKNLRQVKNRAPHKGFIVLCSSVEQLNRCFPSLNLNSAQLQKISSQQNHPTTWIVPARTTLGKHRALLCGANKTVAIRISNHPSVKALCESAGPVLSSSANMPGSKPAKELLKVRKIFRNNIDHYLNEALGEANSPSQIIDLISGEILRSA